MKLVLLMLSCLVAVSVQEANSAYGYNPRTFFNPYHQYLYPGAYGAQSELGQYIEGRSPLKQDDGQERFFFSGLTNVNLRLARTSTITSYVVATSTATIVTTSNCIGAPVLSAKASRCTSRRRRAEAEDFLATLEPTRFEIVEPTDPDTIDRSDDVEVDISSSIDEDQSIFSKDPGSRSLYLTSYVTVTSTQSTFMFSTQTVRNVYSTNLAKASDITCIPIGWGIC